MTYQETLQYLYTSAPLFQQVGGKAYKAGLDTTLTLDAHFGHPHRRYRTIHVAGTNGKGSCAHTLAAFLQCCGWRVGLYTSPHLVDFRERIRVNGEMIPEQRVVDFVAEKRYFFEPLHPSFFELTTALAFQYFAEQEVDIAVIEVGLGGRLDCTNIISPILSVITNISPDHTQFLGHTLTDIAGEKAGIIKAGIPVVVGEALPETRPVFQKAAEAAQAPITFAEDTPEISTTRTDNDGLRYYGTLHYGEIIGELSGDCQVKNTNTILHAVDALKACGLLENVEDISGKLCEAFRHVCSLTGLMGRWQVVRHNPTVILDTGHNIGGWQYLAKRLSSDNHPHVHIVFGMMGDKDISAILELLPKSATYYFTRASVSRSLSEEEVQCQAAAFGLNGAAYPNVETAYTAALETAASKDLIYIGGSSFIVADFLTARKQQEVG